VFRELLAIAAMGAFGAVARYAVSGWAYRFLGDRMAWGTLAVNVLGSFLLGVLMTAGLQSSALPRLWRVALGVGFLGAFTTYSTFSYETVRYLEQGAYMTAVTNVGLNLIVGLFAAGLGLAFGRLVMMPTS
jgi:CrcB protein